MSQISASLTLGLKKICAHMKSRFSKQPSDAAFTYSYKSAAGGAYLLLGI